MRRRVLAYAPRLLSASALASALASAFFACEPPPPPPAPPPPVVKPKEAPTSLEGRPPHANMATAVWGERVALFLGKDVDVSAETKDARALLNEAYAALLLVEPGAEQRAKDLALRAWKKAPDDSTRGTALALVATALVFDPTVDGYAERLTDAFGLSIYAGTVDSSDGLAQALRAVVSGAAGVVRQAKTLIELVEQTPTISEDARVALTLARDAVRQKNDVFFTGAAAAVTARPDASRLRAILAERYLDIGLDGPASALLAQKSEPPALALLAGQAQLARRDPKAAAAIYAPLVERLAGVDEPRRADAIFGLACARVDDTLADDAALAAVKDAAAALAARPGWKKEATYLEAMHGLRTTKDAKAAQALLMPLAQGTPSSTLATERRIVGALLDVCAQTGDVACIQKATRRLDVLDADPAISVRALAQALKLDPEKAAAAAAEAARAESLSSGDDAIAQQLRAARRALAAGAPKLVRPLLDDLVKHADLRVARALRVRTAVDPPETSRFAAAAVLGTGPALVDADLETALDGLGAQKTKEAEAALRVLKTQQEKAPSEALASAIALVENDWKDVESRKKRKAGQAPSPTDEDRMPEAH